MSATFNDIAGLVSIEDGFTCRLHLESRATSQSLDFTWTSQQFAEGFSAVARRGGVSSGELVAFAFKESMPQAHALEKWFRQVLEKGEGRPRVMLQVANGALRDLPWEGLGVLAHLADVDSIPIVRIPPSRAFLAPTRAALPLRVLCVTPNPKARHRMNIDAELQATRPEGVPISWEHLDAESLEAVKAAAAQSQPHVLHFIGHGGCEGEEGRLVFANSFGQPNWVSARQVAAALPPSVRLLCLSSPCTTQNYDLRAFGRLALESSTDRLPSVLFASTPAISSALTHAFWNGAYRALTDSGSVMSAYLAGQKAFGEVPGFEADYPEFALALREMSDVVFLISAAEENAGTLASALASQLASRMANEVAAQAATLGDRAPELLLRHAAAQKEIAEKLEKAQQPPEAATASVHNEANAS